MTVQDIITLTKEAMMGRFIGVLVKTIATLVFIAALTFLCSGYWSVIKIFSGDKFKKN